MIQTLAVPDTTIKTHIDTIPEDWHGKMNHGVVNLPPLGNLFFEKNNRICFCCKETYKSFD